MMTIVSYFDMVILSNRHNLGKGRLIDAVILHCVLWFAPLRNWKYVLKKLLPFKVLPSKKYAGSSKHHLHKI